MGAAAAMMIGQGIATGIGTYQSLSQKEDLLDFNSRQGMIDAQIARQNSEAKAKALRRSGRQLTGQQRTRYAKSGLRLEGTPLEVMAESLENIELDAISTRQAGDFQARQMETKATYDKAQSKHIGKTKLFSSIMSGLGGGGAQGAAGMFK